MKRIFPILFIAALMMTSCAGLYKALYTPPQIKDLDGEMTQTASAKGYEVLYHDENADTKLVKQEETTSVLWQYRTPDGKYHWWVNRDYREAEKTDFWEKDFILDQMYSNSEDYKSKCEDMTPKAYNYYCKNPETGESFKIRQFPWGSGYGYFFALVGEKETIVYSLGVNYLNFY